jgi:UDP-N-acetylmuramoyl-L-alanyl-D-glutamate--2,6-diaminopimelate ligase
LKSLKDILYKVRIEAVKGTTEVVVSGIAFDSRKVELNDVFIAVRGTISDGHTYIETAVNKGALAVICEEFPKLIVNGVTYILVQDANEALAIIASNYYDNPSSKLKLIGVTGTNGKTTVASLLYQLFTNAGFSAGLLSTVKIKVGIESFDATHTTPDSLTINAYLAAMVAQGVTHCFMEVSSHGVHQKRILGLQFDGGVFTNLSHDHLDYHKTFAAYRDVKKSFFDQLPRTAFALVNVDDKNGAVMLQNTEAKKYAYGLKSLADFKANILENQMQGLLLKIDDNEVWTKLIGTFNAYNLLAIYGVSVLLGIEKLEVLRLLSALESVSGRFQFVVSKQNITAIVDYAHTPDALENVINTINDIRTTNEKLITIVGCGGNRDTSKRPIMAQIASNKSDHVILTSDNPRDEDPVDILEAMEQGVEIHQRRKVLTIVDRKQAIKTACQLAQPQDIILIAGKGHETYQEIQGVKHHFDDMETVKALLIQLNK